MSSVFRLPTRVHLFPGAISLLGQEIDRLQSRRVLLVYDEGLGKTPWPEQVRASLAGRCEQLVEFTSISPNPKVSEVDGAAALARDENIDTVVGLGGGSVLDTGKAVSMLISNGGSSLNYEGKNRFPGQPVPFIAIPTTCGTGSEVTWVAVVSDPGAERKISIKGDGMFPSVALVDANLITTLPPQLIAATGLDALTHAIEALVSRASNPVSDALAAHSIELLLTHLPDCVANPEESVAREKVVEASTVAGIAFGNADVGAVHCLSESIGGVFDHPHGLLNAQLLVPVLNYQRSEVAERITSKQAFENPESLISAITNLVDSLRIPPLNSLGIPLETIDQLAELAEMNNSNDSNPRIMTAADYAKILREVLAEAVDGE